MYHYLLYFLCYFEANQITWSDLVEVYRNAFVANCTGHYAGELILKIEDDFKSVVFLMHGTNHVSPFAAMQITIESLVKMKYYQCEFLSFFLIYFYSSNLILNLDTSFTQETLCPICIAQFTCMTSQIGTIGDNTIYCRPLMHVKNVNP